MPTSHFLTESTPLAHQVAGFIREHGAGQTLCITPTAGAARQISATLKAAGESAPQMAQPMQALLPERENVATPVERALAWVEALRELPDLQKQSLFWNRFPETDAELLKAGRNFNRLGDRLAEAALSPATVQMSTSELGGFEEGRWAAISALYATYLECLQDWKLADPNALRLEQIESPPTELERLVIAGVSDLPRAFERFAEKLEAAGTPVDLLIWNPAGLDEPYFDLWGRPEAELWNTRTIKMDPSQITVAPAAQDEARHIVPSVVENAAGLVVVDPKLQSPVVSDILRFGRSAYLPEGVPLIRCEAAKLALEWEAFRHNKDLRRLRRLLELPAFCRVLDLEDPISQTDALIAIDHLLGKTIAGTLEAAWAASPALEEDARPQDIAVRGKVRRLLGAIRSHLGHSALDLIEWAFPESEEGRPETIERILEIGQGLAASPALAGWSKSKDGLPAPVFGQALRLESIQAPAEADAMIVNGWLEAPWLPHEQLVLCGLIEGQLPKAVDGDPFIPDSLCPALGLSHNEQRLARDSYLLHALLASRPTGSVHLSYSKFNTEGDPNRPSRLLLRTELEDLPARVRHLTQPAAATRTRSTRETSWRWQLPRKLRAVEKISPTQFKSYLACPFRFCLQHVLHLDSGPRATHEMDAAVFGNLIHYTLEAFGHELIPMGADMLRMQASDIHSRVQQLLQAEALKQFGLQPAPAVQIQLASAKARLHAYARVQAASFAEGWIIRDVERKLRVDDAQPLMIGPLPLSGMIDRIEQHAETGALRIMDFKTFSAPDKPLKTHLAPLSHNWLDSALVEIQSGTRIYQKTWSDLQLPLYRRILEHWYPAECEAHPPETAYFLLPSDPNETGIATFEELDTTRNPDAYASALNCAEAVAKVIHAGRFWPPLPFRASWNDPAGPIFVNGSPEDCVSPESIALLKGGE